MIPTVCLELYSSSVCCGGVLIHLGYLCKNKNYSILDYFILGKLKSDKVNDGTRDTEDTDGTSHADDTDDTSDANDTDDSTREHNKNKRTTPYFALLLSHVA